MKKITHIMILSIVVLAFVSPQKAHIQASMSAPQQTPNSRPSRTVITPQPATSVDDDWIIECVECNKQLGGMSERSLQLDSEGYPHIAYGGDGLYYTWYNGTGWHLETLDTNPSAYSVSLALDSAGYAHIGYHDRDNDDIKYAFQTESGWQYQVIASDASSSCGGISALVLDELGNPHISYGGDSLYYAHLVSNTWQMIKIVDEGTNIYGPSLALDSQGFPHISYSVREACGPYFSEIQYAYADQAGWNIETVSTGDMWSQASSLVIDANDRLHISYIDSSGFSVEIGTLQYALRDGTGWQTETVGDIHDFKSITSLAVDKEGFPHISYIVNHVKSYGADLMYAYLDKAAWHTQTVVENFEGEVLSTSIALGVDGDPHISYLNYISEPENTYLMYTSWEAYGWDFQTVDERFQGVQAGEYNSLVLDSEDTPHISYYGDAFNSLKYARRDPAGWYTQTVECVGNFETNWWSPTSITLDLEDDPHISYSSSQLKYTYLDDSGWHTQTVAIKEVGRDPSLALDEQGNPHISYIGDDRRLKYAHLDQSGWQIQIVDGDISDWDTVMSNSLALDKDNNPHISYSVHYLKEFPTLNYAVWDGSSWQIEEIESGFLTYAATSLVLDAEGYPHISYIEEDINNLKYAYQDASGWNIQLVDNGFIDRISSSLALDQNGYPHISYTYDDSLRYAFQDASGWRILTLDKGGVFEVSSLALDRYGYPHLSYNKNSDLMYAYLPAPECKVTLWPTNMQLNNMPGSIVTATLQVRNRGQQTDSYNVTIDGNNWSTSMPHELGPLMAAEETTLDIQASIPTTATLGTSDTATITITSQNAPSISTSATVTTYAGYVRFLPLVVK